MAGNVLLEELLALCHSGRVSLLDASGVPVTDSGNTPAVVRVSVSLLHGGTGLPKTFMGLERPVASRGHGNGQGQDGPSDSLPLSH